MGDPNVSGHLASGDTASEGLSPVDFHRWSALVCELDTGVGLMAQGIAIYRTTVSFADSRVVPLFLMANGLERLLRCALCMAWWRDHGCLPVKRDFRQQGLLSHDIPRMWGTLEDWAKPPSPELAEAVAEIGRAGTALNDALRVLADQAEGDGRYRVQNAYLGNVEQYLGKPSPDIALASLELGILYWRGLVPAFVVDDVRAIKAWRDAMVAVAGRFSRIATTAALMFSQGALGARAQELSGLVKPLLRPPV